MKTNIINRMRTDYESGSMPLSQIADNFDQSYRNIIRLKSKYQWSKPSIVYYHRPPRKKKSSNKHRSLKYPPIVIISMEFEYEIEGLTMPEIASKWGCNQSTVSRYKKKFHWATRGSGDKNIPVNKYISIKLRNPQYGLSSLT